MVKHLLALANTTAKSIEDRKIFYELNFVVKKYLFEFLPSVEMEYLRNDCEDLRRFACLSFSVMFLSYLVVLGRCEMCSDV